MKMNLNISPTTDSSMSSNTKIKALETILQQSVQCFKELVEDFEKMHIESEMYKIQYLTQQQQCSSENCKGAESLKKIIKSKDNIIQSVASTLMILNETKDFDVLKEVFKIMFQDETDTKNTETEKLTVKQESNNSFSEENIKEFSINEIEGTPTGRISPIIQPKKSKSVMVKSSDVREKKKCPGECVNFRSTPEKKTIKLIYPTPKSGRPNGKLRQSRLNLVAVKQNHVVDLTSSPEFCGGLRTCRSSNEPVIKTEPPDNDETILPSPTSGCFNLAQTKSIVKKSPIKFKKPHLSLSTKKEPLSKLLTNNNENEIKREVSQMEDSINILNQFSKRFTSDNKQEALKEEEKSVDEDSTHCDSILSGSLLQERLPLHQSSPRKLPLAENINIINTPTKCNIDSSMSLLPHKLADTTDELNTKRKLPKPVEPIYKEPTVRKKSEKRALPGWLCEECENFFGELYKDDPEMLAKKIEECSKHRGRNNPARPKTPPNYWNPRWTVPEDTEELNRINNAN